MHDGAVALWGYTAKAPDFNQQTCQTNTLKKTQEVAHFTHPTAESSAPPASFSRRSIVSESSAPSPRRSRRRSILLPGSGCFAKGPVESCTTSTLLWKVRFEKCWRFQPRCPAEITWVRKLEKEVDMAGNDPHQLCHAIATEQDVEHQQRPREIHCRKLGSKVEGDHNVFVALRPSVHDCHCDDLPDYHQPHKICDCQRHKPAHQKHRNVVSWSSLEQLSLHSQRVRVQEVQVDQERKAHFAAIEKRGAQTPNVKLVPLWSSRCLCKATVAVNVGQIVNDEKRRKKCRKVSGEKSGTKHVHTKEHGALLRSQTGL